MSPEKGSTESRRDQGRRPFGKDNNRRSYGVDGPPRTRRDWGEESVVTTDHRLTVTRGPGLGSERTVVDVSEGSPRVTGSPKSTVDLGTGG